ncbi:MAG: transcription-repair coupling factor [Oscillospiraceae bacterium]|nr:transcription-repair coupling factor [Oscillospiraceae bacterium]
MASAILKNPKIPPLPRLLEGEYLPTLFSGLSGITTAALPAALRLETGRPVFVVCPDDTSALSLARDLEAFCGEAVGVITTRDFTFYTAEGVSRQAEQERTAVFDSLCRGNVSVAVCAASALMRRAIPPQALQKAAFTVEKGMRISMEDAVIKLMNCGYTRADPVEGPGQYSKRGGILDFFSPLYENPTRVEFWGDEVFSLGFFDTESQRRIETVESCRIIPAAETLASLYEDGEKGLAAALSKAAEKAKEKKDRCAQGLIKTLEEDARRLTAGIGLSAADRYMGMIYKMTATAADYIPDGAVVVLDRPAKIKENMAQWQKQNIEDLRALVQNGTLDKDSAAGYNLSPESAFEKISGFPVIMTDSFRAGSYPFEPRYAVDVVAKRLPSYGGSAETAAGDVMRHTGNGYGVIVLCSDKRRAGVMCEFLRGKGIPAALDPEPAALPAAGRCIVSEGSLSAGFEYPGIKLAVITDTQILGPGKNTRRRSLKKRHGEKPLSYSDLSVGDLVVHEYHGIGRFAGIFGITVDGAEKDYIKIRYAGTDSLYVPATQSDLIGKYTGGDETSAVRLSKLGGADWNRAKTRAKAAAKDMADGLIELYAQRSKIKGHTFARDSTLQAEFEDGFDYTETDDQLKCAKEIKDDMEKPVPMDRLLCGDVGYGKTEVALRAVMKCVSEGKQAAVLVPTTVLAEQHAQTIVRRFFGIPAETEILSRFRSPEQIKKALKDIKSGKADIVIGTHRLLQKDVEFKDLGLLVVDEEQRFGVAQKERLKEMFAGVDVLTLSATPIPRTLNMALAGIRDMSAIEEPPPGRQPVQTYVLEYDPSVICDAICRELRRGGQIYYLHNRVETIDRCAARLAEMPEIKDACIAVAHGKMDEENLSSVMESMISGETRILVCTTIIEAGIDIPNVNTLIIEDADKLGLAQLHQIRGRVGRSGRRASAYLTFRRNKIVSETAEKRLSAIREFAEFNAGFKIAMRDLEIRGAGNLLGAEQSGHMNAVGYDMYIRLLEEAVSERRGETRPKRLDCTVDLSVSAGIPAVYVPSAEQRMDLYRRIALIATREEADDLEDELADRFGKPPGAAVELISAALLRSEASRAGISEISQKAGFLKFKIAVFDPAKVSSFYGFPEFKDRVRIEASAVPTLSLKTVSKNVTEEARSLVAAYAAAGSQTNA